MLPISNKTPFRKFEIIPGAYNIVRSYTDWKKKTVD